MCKHNQFSLKSNLTDKGQRMCAQTRKDGSERLLYTISCICSISILILSRFLIGHMLASCLPVYQTIPELEFKGVACINILLSTITSGVEFFSDGEYSYGFIMERSGRAIIHPLLPKPTQSRYTFLDIENLEPHVKINVTDHMKL